MQLLQVNSVWLQVTMTLVSLSLLIAPFRSSAGVRAGLFVLAFLLIFYQHWRDGGGIITWPDYKPLHWCAAVWLLTALIYSLLGPDWRISLLHMRGDALTPILACLVCYCLVRQTRIIWPILVALFVGLIVLMVMVVHDPFRPMIGVHEPRYVSVGWLSTWLVMLAALVPLGWNIKWRSPRLATVIAALSVCAILVAAWFTANRIIWICFGAMTIIYMLMSSYRVVQSRRGLATFTVVVLAACAALFYISSNIRASHFPDAVDGAISLLKNDDRQIIWREALETIAERPLVGHGYKLEAGAIALSQRFDNPWHREVIRQPHNIVLNAAIQTGIPGALSLLALFAGLLLAFWHAWRHAGHAEQKCFAICGVMLIAGFFLRNMTDDFFSRHAVLLLGALIGLLLGGSTPERSDASG
jgi:O-antigen ligase